VPYPGASRLAWVSFRVLAVAETDSYLKWAVRLLAQLPADAVTDLVIASSPVRPSASQQESALAGTALAGSRPAVVPPSGLVRRAERDHPDAILLACAGPTAHAYQRALARAFGGRRVRPVLLAGVPGIALPARARAWLYRGGIDLFVVHSHREVEDYERTRVETGKAARVGLATLPFLTGSAIEGDGAQLAPGEPTRVVFATQAKVPMARRQREQILLALDALARARPDLRVVVKTRGAPGEFHTHHEALPYGDLWRNLMAAGQVADTGSLEFAAGSMAQQLHGAAALVTVSSTAVLEAMALDVPVLLIDEFGLSEELINEVFVDSGCLGGLAALAAADFRRPQASWLAGNYFHLAGDNTWVGLLEDLVAAARAGELPSIATGLGRDRSPLRRLRDSFRLTSLGGVLGRGWQRGKQQVSRRPGRRADRACRSASSEGRPPVAQSL
jgi:hypothetical protein